MQSHTHWTDIPDEAKGCSAAIGNFDGVHLGHRRVIDLARQHGPLGLVTFEPHPREYFAPGAPPFRLMNAEAKANRLAKLGVEQMFQLPFDADMAAMAADPLTQEWWDICMPMQSPLHSRADGDWWASTEEVFHLD